MPELTEKEQVVLLAWLFLWGWKPSAPRPKKPLETAPLPSRLLTVDEMAQLVGCSKSWLYKLVEWRLLACYRVGRMIRFDPSQRDEIASKSPNAQATPKETHDH